MKTLLKTFGSILLVGLLLAKSSAFHILEHQDSSEAFENHCELCVLALENQQLAFLDTPAKAEVPTRVVLPLQEESQSTKSAVFSSLDKQAYFFSRPPPAYRI